MDKISMNKLAAYEQLLSGLDALCADEPDVIARMATIACELYHAFDYFDWVGFYRNMGDESLKIGPYQGSHGCLVIPFAKGVCGKCARERKTQHVPDVDAVADHIACSSTTRSEVVIPLIAEGGELVGVLDIDSNALDAFDPIDLQELAKIVRYF